MPHPPLSAESQPRRSHRGSTALPATRAVRTLILVSAIGGLISCSWGGNSERSVFSPGSIVRVGADEVCVGRANGPPLCAPRVRLSTPEGADPRAGDCVVLEVPEGDRNHFRSATWTSHCAPGGGAIGVLLEGPLLRILIPSCLSAFRGLSIEDADRAEIWRIDRVSSENGEVLEVHLGERPAGFDESVKWRGGPPTGRLTVYVEQLGLAPTGSVTFEADALQSDVLATNGRFKSVDDFRNSKPCES